MRSGSADGHSVASVTVTAAQSCKPSENRKKTAAKKDNTKHAAKKRKPNADATFIADDGALDAAFADLPSGAEDDFDPRIIMNPDTGMIEWKDYRLTQATKVMPQALAPGTMVNIYTDGSSLANGQSGAIAGVGVFFGPHDPK